MQVFRFCRKLASLLPIQPGGLIPFPPIRFRLIIQGDRVKPGIPTDRAARTSPPESRPNVRPDDPALPARGLTLLQIHLIEFHDCIHN